MSRLRRALALSRDDAGLSLSELLVVMMMFGIMMTVVTSLFISYTKAAGSGRSIDMDTRAASNGMNEVARIVRAGTANPVQGSAVPEPAFADASRETLTVTAFVNLTSSATRPVKVRFWLNAKRDLVEETTQAVALANGYWRFTGAVSTRVLASDVAVRTGSDPWLFTYRKADGTVLTPDASGALGADQRALVGSVQVTLKVRGGGGSGPGVTLQNTVGLPNLAVVGVGP